MKAVVYTLGCKVNDVESGSIIRGLEEMGYEVSRELVEADLYIINTCAVTAEAERKSRQTVGKAIKCNPTAKVIVCGCASEKSPVAFSEKGHTVYAVTGAQRKNKVLEIVSAGLENGQVGICLETEKAYEEMPLP
ncbi:MAG: tRNA (N(6)-L-threonylcarbamoyladenosine(37)-C(2))-methylthiotransferase MtaB, partial [Clostridia bacterium]|nr:tRNA (N(6)-L-threonylcarbamoyladenosine(37)-C(2))-methylthiotransferase MtaB [Clostridia bacterium]